MKTWRQLRAICVWGGILAWSICTVHADVMRLDPLRRETHRVIPYVIPDFAGSEGQTLARVVRENLDRYGDFVAAQVSPQDVQTLDNADRQRRQIHFRNWANLGVQILGKGVVNASGNRLEVEFVLYTPHDGRTVFARKYSGSMQGLRMISHRISDDIVQAILQEKGFFASRLLFVQGDYRHKNIAISDSDGHNVTLLTQGDSISIFPCWFPDGRKILFTSYFEGRPIMYEMELQSAATRRLLALPGMNVSGAVSPDGRHLAAIIDKDGQSELYVMTIGGGPMTRLTRGRSAESSPSWSPCGNYIAYASDSAEGRPHIFIMGRTGGRPQRVTTGIFSNYCTTPRWSPDGKKIAFVARRGGAFQICLYDVQTQELHQVTQGSSNSESPSWARNSRHIAFARTHGHNARILLLDTQTGKETPLVSRGQFSGSPAWQP